MEIVVPAVECGHDREVSPTAGRTRRPARQDSGASRQRPAGRGRPHSLGRVLGGSDEIAIADHLLALAGIQPPKPSADDRGYDRACLLALRVEERDERRPCPRGRSRREAPDLDRARRTQAAGSASGGSDPVSPPAVASESRASTNRPAGLLERRRRRAMSTRRKARRHSAPDQGGESSPSGFASGQPPRRRRKDACRNASPAGNGDARRGLPRRVAADICPGRST